jgi:hypothetical protein
VEASNVNHVPDTVLAAIDGLGKGLLRAEPTTVDARLRTDSRVRIERDRAPLDAGEAPTTFRLEHGTAHPTLLDHGSYLGTVVDNVETRLRAWGIEPPASYTHRGTEDGWQVYRGRARLP